jgi:hypothetical protein
MKGLGVSINPAVRIVASKEGLLEVGLMGMFSITRSAFIPDNTCGNKGIKGLKYHLH